MKRKSFLVVCAGLALASVGLIGSTVLRAAPPAGGRGGSGGGMLAQLKTDMNVTDEQRQQVRKVVIAHRDDIAAVARPLIEANRALREATLAETPDESAIHAAADKVGKSVGDVAVLVSKMKGELKDVFTPEQLKTLGTFEVDVDDKIDTVLDRLENGGK